MKSKLIGALFFIAFFISLLIPRANAAVTLEAADAPWWVIVPSIGLSSPIQSVGINSKGNMDVPSGTTKNVGWYKYGVVPGNTGTAVLDAHVTAAFKDLSKLAVGSDIYIYTTSGRLQHFIVTASHDYQAASLSPLTLFAPSENKDLNLITCSGILLPNGEATGRLIVSARLEA